MGRAATGETVYEVDRVIAARILAGGGVQYRVRWWGFGAAEDTWEPADELLGCTDALDAFHASLTRPLHNHASPSAHLSDLNRGVGINRGDGGGSATSEAEDSGWLSTDPHQRATEVFVAGYSAVWMLAVAVVVASGVYDRFTAAGYVAFGASLALPSVLYPLLARLESEVPWYRRYWVVASVWTAVFAYVGNHFFTHYFYNVLGCSYSVPTEDGWWTVNRVPVVMYLLTHPYFLSYHVMASCCLRRLGFHSPQTSFLRRAASVTTLAYATAYMETWSISAFPHYRYPDLHAMLTVGSAFYALMFVVSFPAFAAMAHAEKTSLLGTVQHALACGMAVFLLFDVWRLAVGTVAGGSQQMPYAGS